MASVAENLPDGPTLGFIPTMQPTLVADPPAGEGWLHEIKYDGYRTELVIDAGGVRAFTRNGFDWTAKYAPVVTAAGKLRCRSAIIDGEIIIQDDEGRSDFGGLRSAIHGTPERLVYYAFDLLHLDGEDMRKRPLIERRAMLRDLVGADPGSPIQFSEHVIGNGAALFDGVEAMGLEGIVSKQVNSRYRSGPTTAWLKIKCFADGAFYIVGVERGTGPTMILLAREAGATLEYAGGAMLTLSEPERERFWAEAATHQTDRPAVKLDKRKKVQWLRPEMRARVRFLKGGDKLRHASVLEILR